MKYLVLLSFLLTGCFSSSLRDVDPAKARFSAGDEVRIKANGFYHGCTGKIRGYHPFLRDNEIHYNLQDVVCKETTLEKGLYAGESDLELQ